MNVWVKRMMEMEVATPLNESILGLELVQMRRVGDSVTVCSVGLGRDYLSRAAA